MAYVTEFTCSECRTKRTEVVSGNGGICSTCRSTIARIKKTAHMSRLAALPIEERVRRIESDLYDLNIDSRLKKLEVKNITY